MDETKLDKVKNYLNSLLEYEWEWFDKRRMMKQSKTWRKILSDFKSLLKEVREENDKLDIAITALIGSYHEKYCKLPFMGRIYVAINPFFLAGCLGEQLEELKFEEESKNWLDCDCILKNKYKKTPLSENLKDLGSHFDGYYTHEIHECINCNFKWKSFENIEGSRYDVYWEKWDELEYPLNLKRIFSYRYLSRIILMKTTRRNL